MLNKLNKFGMKVELSYEEIINKVERNFLIRPQLVYIDDKTIDIVYKPSRFMPSMSIRLYVEGCRKDEVCLSYKCSAPMSIFLLSAIGHLGNKIPNGVNINTSDQRVILDLNQIDGLDRLLSYAELETISIHNNHVEVGVRIK